MRVLKFGGSSVAQADRIRKVIQILQSYLEREEPFAVVVSAFGGITDLLIAMSRQAENGDLGYKMTLEQHISRHFEAVSQLIAPERRERVRFELKESQIELANILQGIFLINELSPRTLDNILSHGERCSAFIISEAMRDMGIDAYFLDARKLVRTDSHFGSARVDKAATYHNIRQHFESHKGIAIVTGFIGANEKGVTTTLGRGGSDYTAAIFGAALDASEIEIWTDVDGVLTADPRRVNQAFPVSSMTYEEAMEMSHFGAKVIYPPTIVPAMERHIPLRIKNTFNPGYPGTLISHSPEKDTLPIKGIASINQVAVLRMQGAGLFGEGGSGMASRLFAVLEQEKVNVILITQGSSEHFICFAVKPEDAGRAAGAINREFELEIQAGLIEPMAVEDNLSVIAVVGENMRAQPGVSGRLFTALGRNGINVVVTAQGSSERNITVVIPRQDETKALNAVHESFFLSNTFTLNLFIVGPGLIGSTLMKQIQQHAAFLREKRYMELNVAGLANSKRMLLNDKGIDLSNWQEQLAASPEGSTVVKFCETMIRMNLPNSVFVDCTANENIVELYETILDNSISVSTPNKEAAAGPFARYERIKQLADRRGVYFQYETNVGAGLPVLTTIADLVNSGDQILKIEGILSGSLSFIFNHFKEGTRFSDIVQEARRLGYTEPDPRIDLSGKDVARKLSILARESGIRLEQQDIRIQNILPAACIEAPNVDSFMQELAGNDEYFESLRAKAAAAGKVLRFIATLEGAEAFITLQALDAGSPFYNLSGSDNMIVFTTDRYKERPLVIKGPGAGAEVTAAGLLAEIIRIGNSLSPILRLPEKK